MDLDQILKTKSFSELIDTYDNVMRQGILPETATTEEELEGRIIPTETPYIVNENAVKEESKKLFTQNGGNDLSDFVGLNNLNNLLIYAKFKGDKKLFSEEKRKNIPETLTLEQLTGVKFTGGNILLKDLNQDIVNKIKESEGFSDEQKVLFQKALDFKQNIFDYADNITKQITDTQDKPSFVLGLLKDSILTLSEKDEHQDLFDVFEILEKENQKITDPTFDLGGYIISKKIDEDQIQKSIDQIKKLRISLHELTVFENGDESMFMADEAVLKLNKREFDKKGLNFTQDLFIKINAELNYHEDKLKFLLEVSK